MLERFLDRFRNYVIGGLLIAVGVTTLGWVITDARLDACTSGRKADKALYQKAQADAEVLWMKAIKVKEKEYEAKANKADEAYGTLAGKYNDAIRLYAAAQGRSRVAPTSPGSDGAASDNRPSEDTEFLEVREVVVPVGDLAICAENTARLVIARDWALGLNK